jgi:hypothetical protein
VGRCSATAAISFWRGGDAGSVLLHPCKGGAELPLAGGILSRLRLGLTRGNTKTAVAAGGQRLRGAAPLVRSGSGLQHHHNASLLCNATYHMDRCCRQRGGKQAVGLAEFCRCRSNGVAARLNAKRANAITRSRSMGLVAAVDARSSHDKVQGVLAWLTHHSKQTTTTARPASTAVV